jgi:hypothetical protein
VLSLDADIEDVRSEVGTPGRYRFDPIDDANKAIEGAPVGYAYVHGQVPTIAPAAPASSDLGEASDNVVIESMRMNSKIAMAVVDKFHMMMESAAVLLRAADAAGMPARLPFTLPDEDSDDEAYEVDEAAPRASISMDSSRRSSRW